MRPYKYPRLEEGVSPAVLGALATFQFYVMATTGNENGGKAVKIVRPMT